MNRILFVDDDANVLQGLRRMLRDMRQEWHMEFAGGGQEALEVLAKAPFDIVVTDMRMPGMDGGQLLTEVMQRYPHMVRIVLSGQAEEAAVIRTVGAVHQYLSKPCDAETLKKTVARACALRSVLADENLKRVLSHIQSLPSLPALYTRLLEECQNPRGSLRTVGEIIAEDVGMTAKILHLVNSAFFGLRTRVSSPVQAVQLLGLDTVKSLTLCASVFSQFEGALHRFPLMAFWRHSLVAGSFARIVATAEQNETTFANDASVAGLLHDAGQLVLAANLPDRYAQALDLARTEEIPIADAETKVFGASHAMVGAYLLGLWGLPDSVVEAVARHHDPSNASDLTFAPLTAVHVADALADEVHAGGGPDAKRSIDEAYIVTLGMTNRIQVWRERCLAYAGETNSDE